MAFTVNQRYFFSRALSCMTPVKIRWVLPKLYHELALMYADKGEMEKAQNYLLKASELFF
jgi:hypothetical protein